jgi:electron-transferring-flavoprotein dehydrogenase
VDDLNKVDVLFVGAGPANLAGAIKLKQLLNAENINASVVVIEKSDKPGQHNLSGAVFEADVLDDLLTDWRNSEDEYVKGLLANKVEVDDLYFLMSSNSAIKIPEFAVPSVMHHKGDYTTSVSQLVKWLAGIARGLGVEIYNGFAARELIIDGDTVKGVKLGDKGLDKENKPMCNYLPSDTIEAKVTVLGEGSLGQLAEKLIDKFKLNTGKNQQIHSLGIKEIIKLPENNKFGKNRVIHTLGFPNSNDIFGGGTIYSMSENTVAVAIVMALDWKYCDLNPQQELQVFKSHSLIKSLLEGGEVIAYGAKTLPEGGYYSLPEPYANGAIIVGDDAGFTNAQKLKGLHYAIKSGILAGEAIFSAVKSGSFTKKELKKYADLLEQSFIIKDLENARNYRQLFNLPGGILAGAPLSFIQGTMSRMETEPDYQGMRRIRLNRKYNGGIDRLTDVSLSGTIHREDEPSHITFKDNMDCKACYAKFGYHPCESFCPGEVYRFEEDELVLSPSNCLHCQTCRVKCPTQNIVWVVPEGGDGPKYKVM